MQPIPSPEHIQRVLARLHKSSEAALESAHRYLQASRAGKLPKLKTVIKGNHMMIFYENDRLARNWRSAGAPDEESPT